jgi:hypothetical protein
MVPGELGALNVFDYDVFNFPWVYQDTIPS